MESTITSAQYVARNDENTSIRATIDGTEMIVPLDPNNRHYQAILEWNEEAANEILAAE